MSGTRCGNRDGAQPGAPATGVCSTDDPSLYEHAVRPWEVIASPLEGGRFRYRMHHLVTGSFVLYDETFYSQVRLRSQSPANVVALSVPIHSPSDSTFWKAPLGTLCMPAMLGGALDVQFSAGHRQVVVLVDGSLLGRHLAPAQVTALEIAAAAHRLPRSPPRLGAFREWLLRVIHDVGGAAGPAGPCGCPALT